MKQLSRSRRGANRPEQDDSAFTPRDPGSQARSRLLVGAGLLLPTFLWAYWTTWGSLVDVWSGNPDYGHGFLVVPIALFVCWQRREALAERFTGEWAWLGLLLIAGSLAMRAAAKAYYITPLEGYSILVWVAGLACLLGGVRFLGGCLPSIAFLIFMVPLPYRFSLMLRLPLQRVATNTSCWILQCLGEPAFAEGNTVLFHEHQLEVEQACSGLRIFMGIFALAFAFMIASRRSVWEKLLILVSALPIALLVNSLRIVGTGLCIHYSSSEVAVKLAHDVAGWVMVPAAAVIFAGFVWYLGQLVREVERVEVQEILQHDRAPT